MYQTKSAAEVGNKRGKLRLEDFLFLVRKDPRKEKRIKEV